MACIAKRRGRYVIDCYDQNGKRYRKTMRADATKEEARKELREIEAKIERRTFLHEKKAPFFREVKEQWLKYKKDFLRENTYEACETNLKTHFVLLDDMRINAINIGTIEKFISDLQRKPKSTASTRKADYVPTGNEKKISINTVRKIIVILNQIMAYAVRHRLIDFNPVTDAERPRSQGKEQEQERGIAILTPKQIQKFLEQVKNQKYQTLFLTAIMTGARQGELLGLNWADIDFQKKQACINRTFNSGRFFTPKTKSSIRRIDLSPMAVKALAEWKLASGGKDDDLVFYADNKPEDKSEPLKKTPMNYSNMVQRHFRKALKDAKIKQIRFHDLRHTYASLLLTQGENIKYVQTQLGHSSPTVTLNVYAHLMKKENQEAACRLENAIFEGTGHNLVTEEEKGQAVNGVTP